MEAYSSSESEQIEDSIALEILISVPTAPDPIVFLPKCNFGSEYILDYPAAAYVNGVAEFNVPINAPTPTVSSSSQVPRRLNFQPARNEWSMTGTCICNIVVI